MADRNRPEGQRDEAKQGGKRQRADREPRVVPKPESTSEYEGAPTRKPTGNPGNSVKTESTSEYEGAEPSKPE